MKIIIAMGIQASLLIVIVLIMRFFTKRLPKIYIHMLWLLVVARLLLPVFIESSIGVLPQPTAETVLNQSEGVVTDENTIFFDSRNTIGGQHYSSKEEITEFINTVNYYLENSRLLVSTLDGVTEIGDGQACDYRENLDVMNFDMESRGLNPDDYTVEEKIELIFEK